MFVAAELAARRGKAGGLPQRTLAAIENAEFTLVFSYNMAERLAERLEDVVGLSSAEAVVVTAAYVALADPPGLLTRDQPVVALGTGPHAEEDARVVEAALAGRANYLVTYNVADFLPAATPHPTTGRASILGVEIVRPYDLALIAGWRLDHTPMQARPASEGP